MFFFFITFLKALAALLITNTHYPSVYPIALLASGGLLGNIIFFAVSGFTLINPKQSFIFWYLKRVFRIYPSVWIITTIYILLGFYTFDEWSISTYYFYPTYYHFIGSIIVLYIPYYFVVTNEVLLNHVNKLMLGVFILQIVVYVFFYDKSYYHIDTVREPMIRFLFFQAMLLGVRFRMYKEDYLNTNKKLDWVWLCFALLIYFLSKLAFSRLDTISHYQLLNHITIFISLYFVMKCFAGIEQKLQGLPEKLKAVITKIAQITLEIYMVQFVIIRCFAKLSFPGNWFLITSLIFTCALCLQTLTNFTKSIFEKMYFFFFPKHKTEP